TVCRRHADALLQTFERGERAYWELPDAAWLAEYGPEIDNLRAAIDWAAQHDGRLALAMLSHGTDLFVLLSLHHECRERFAGVAGEMTNLAYGYMALGRYEEAVQLGRELLGSPRPAQGRTRLYQLGNTACALLLADDGNAAEARALLSEMLELSSLDGWDSFG